MCKCVHLFPISAPPHRVFSTLHMNRVSQIFQIRLHIWQARFLTVSYICSFKFYQNSLSWTFDDVLLFLERDKNQTLAGVFFIIFLLFLLHNNKSFNEKLDFIKLLYWMAYPIFIDDFFNYFSGKIFHLFLISIVEKSVKTCSKVLWAVNFVLRFHGLN